MGRPTRATGSRWLLTLSLLAGFPTPACADVWGFRDLGGPDSNDAGATDGAVFDSAQDGPPWQDGGDGAHDEASDDAESCTCSPGVSCAYSVSEPPSEYGAPYPVNTVVLTPASPSATWVETIHTPPAPYYDWQWTDVDVRAFPNGGMLLVSGTTALGCMTSQILTTECAAAADAGPDWIENVANVDAGSGWSFPAYAFGSGTEVLHVGSQGAWEAAWCSPSCVTGGTNTNTITARVQ